MLSKVLKNIRSYGILYIVGLYLAFCGVGVLLYGLTATADVAPFVLIGIALFFIGLVNLLSYLEGKSSG